jgi:hypothetical protein
VSTGEDEERASKLDKAEDAISRGILMRLELLNGAPPDLEAVKNLKWRDRRALQKTWNEVEGGIDTEMKMTCKSCGHEFKKDLEIGASFFFPSEA